MEVAVSGQFTEMHHRHPCVSVVYIGHQRLKDLTGRPLAVRARCSLIKNFTDRPQHSLQCYNVANQPPGNSDRAQGRGNLALMYGRTQQGWTKSIT